MNEETLAAKLHEIYMEEARRQGDVRHQANYDDLPETVKDFDRVIARYILENWTEKPSIKYSEPPSFEEHQEKIRKTLKT